LHEGFRKFAHAASAAAGSALTFVAAVLLLAAWAATGPLFAFSDTWQLLINTTTTIVTFLMVFLIQNTQNRDSQALHAKLDEIIVATEGARNRMAIAEDLSDDELAQLKRHFEQVADSPAGEHDSKPDEDPLDRRAAEATGGGSSAA
jgi:low affinity Fe/Cu permease